MSAPTPAPGDDRPREGYYPDPSIPGYVRYWNGASWVPGTSRPAPGQDATGPGVTPGAVVEPHQGAAPAAAPVEETGPVFFDEEEAAQEAASAARFDPSQQAPVHPGGLPVERAHHPEPASAWQADTSRQGGFGNDADRRVSWGGEPGEGQVPGQGPRGADPRAFADAGPDPRRPALPHGAAPAALPAGRDGGHDGPVHATPDARSGDPSSDGAAVRAAGRDAVAPAPSPYQPPAGPQRQQPARQQGPAPVREPFRTPGAQAGPGQGAASWAQPQQPPQQQQQAQQPLQAQQSPQAYQPQGVQQAAPQAYQSPRAAPQIQAPAGAAPFGGPGAAGPQAAEQPVVPWKPPVDDPFQQMARAQSAGRPAGLGRRLVARLFDTVVLGALVGAAGFPLVTAAIDHMDAKIEAAKLSGRTVTVHLLDSTTAGQLGGALAAFLVVGFLLEALPTAKWGRTLGKKLLGIQVRDVESQDVPTLGAALRRWLVHGLLGLLVIGVFDAAWCLFDRPWRQCWHDKAARTFVAG
ncbi:RDD family protein [Streptomyces sp. NBC_00102]|uniref:RDD family protein n=1 Tax=Streptomyces sp. NBC_00102 TaxID=2975652 RepID=UPI00225BCFAB|nr:RDD family protein [Streptomyces sp. NBC_00102]MCX5397317.1 RDD family protein [Streptomyces sp. NBC_00102]